MRTILIAAQAGIITLLAVIGAYGESDSVQTCPLPTAKADLSCQE